MLRLSWRYCMSHKRWATWGKEGRIQEIHSMAFWGKYTIPLRKQLDDVPSSSYPDNKLVKQRKKTKKLLQSSQLISVYIYNMHISVLEVGEDAEANL